MVSRTSSGVKLFWCSLFLAASMARAQEPQLFLTDQRAFGQLGPAPTAQSQPDEADYRDELGPLHPLMRLRETPFQVYSDTSYLYDSNILLTFHKPVTDMVLDQVFGASYSPRIFDDLKTTLYAQHYIDRYDSNSAFDFDGDQAGVDFSYTLVKPPIPYHQEETSSTWTLYGDGSYERLTSTPDDAQIFQMVDTRIGLRCDFNSLLPSWTGIVRPIAPFYGYQFDWRVSDPNLLTRADNTFFLGASMDVVRNVYLQLLAQGQWQDYLNVNRSDITETLSASLVWRINKYASLNASALFANNNSSLNTFSYKVLNAGPNLTLQIRF
jgi:Putative beta-barrel porin 2